MNSKYDAFLSNGNDFRKFLQKPIQLDSGSVYSNGAAFVFENGGNGEIIGKHSEHIAEVVFGFIEKINNYSGDYIHLPSVEESDCLCGDCGGAGVKEKSCIECDDNGEIEFENDYNGGRSSYDVTCASCNGFPQKGRPCDTCEGMKLCANRNNFLEISKVYFDPYYILLASKHLDNPRCFIDDDALLIIHDAGYAGIMRKRK